MGRCSKLERFFITLREQRLFRVAEQRKKARLFSTGKVICDYIASTSLMCPFIARRQYIVVCRKGNKQRKWHQP